jgi:hypothetical protein
MLHWMIQWRNNLTHTRAENTLRVAMKDIFTKNKDTIRNNYRNLDIDIMLQKFNQHDYPDFKEVAGLLKATHLFVDEVDFHVVNDCHIRRYVAARLKKYFSSSRRIQRLGNIFCADEARRKNYFTQVLKEFGLASSQSRPSSPETAFFSFGEIETWCSDFDEAKQYLVG